jgi:diguanylate cyclase (GGDEF)-like protein
MLWTLLSVSVVRDAARAPLYLVAQITDVTSRKKAEERLMYLAGHDALTGAMNRLQLVESLGQSIAYSRRQGQRVAALVLDLDGFKLVNDSLGHMVGDLLLQDVAGRLQTLVRTTDHVARLGGDEFVLVLNGINDCEDIARVAQKIIEAVSQPFSIEGQEILLTASVGVSVSPDDGDSVAGILKNADDAMYRAKELGKNNYQFYTLDMTAKAVQRLKIERDLRGALAASEFLLHYQPILKSGRVVAIEALLRWNHAEMGLMDADRFVPSAEETGLIVPIGRWVMLQACAQMRAWRDAGITDARIAVNLSARQFRDPDLLRTITDALAQTGLAPNCLELEITESSIMHDGEQTIGILRHLRQIGVHVSIDDFGTGYSSLSYLKRFPLDGLKVDRSFIKDFPLDSDRLAIVQAIIVMARSLKLNVTAEGVETEHQHGVLEKLECDAMQGFYFSGPVPAQELERVLRTFSGTALEASPALPSR